MINRCNLDYEFSLFDPFYQRNKSKYKRYGHYFEYVYLFIEKMDSILATDFPYPKDYLLYLQKFGLTIPKFTTDLSKAQNWWGALQNLSLERFLNSKITSTLLAKSRNLCHPATKILYTPKDLQFFIESERNFSKFVFKSPFLMSGQGNFFYERTDCVSDRSFNLIREWWQKKSPSSPIIVEPFLDVLLEIGLYFDHKINDNSPPPLVHINSIDSRGIFRGGLVFKENFQLLNYLEKEYSNSILPHWNHVINESMKIAKEFQNAGAVFGFGIDAFIYKEGDELRSYPLLEVNYRKTMGLMLHSLKFLIPDPGIGNWCIFPLSKSSNTYILKDIIELLGPLNYDPTTKEGIILTSPPNGQLLSVYIISSKLTSINSLKSDFLSIADKYILNPSSGNGHI